MRNAEFRTIHSHRKNLLAASPKNNRRVFRHPPVPRARCDDGRDDVQRFDLPPLSCGWKLTIDFEANKKQAQGQRP